MNDNRMPAGVVFTPAWWEDEQDLQLMIDESLAIGEHKMYRNIHWAGAFWTSDAKDPQYEISLLKKFDPINDGEQVWNEFMAATGLSSEQITDYFIGDGSPYVPDANNK